MINKKARNLCRAYYELIHDLRGAGMRVFYFAPSGLSFKGVNFMMGYTHL